MPSLKDLKNRIASVKSTQKITSAMKMVAAAKLRRAQEAAEASRPYAERMAGIIASLAGAVTIDAETSPLLAGTGSDQVHLLVVLTSDRGLCGAFNASIVREARRRIRMLLDEGKTVKLLTVGRKGRDLLRRDYQSLIVESYTDIGRRGVAFAEADTITQKVLDLYAAGEFDICSVIYNQFKSAISQVCTVQQVVPTALPEVAVNDGAAQSEAKALYEFEPDEEQILTALLPKNLAVQMFKALLESSASEMGARMTAMDNATRNAGDMIRRLTLVYNRTRQANITRELIEIISGAEAL
jgi:F-type H+-transporting ATPase subunit gamma